MQVEAAWLRTRGVVCKSTGPAGFGPGAAPKRGVSTFAGVPPAFECWPGLSFQRRSMARFAARYFVEQRNRAAAPSRRNQLLNVLANARTFKSWIDRISQAGGVSRARRKFKLARDSFSFTFTFEMEFVEISTHDWNLSLVGVSRSVVYPRA